MKQAITGCLLGTAVGDAMGLPYEGLKSPRGVRLLGEPDTHHFIFGRGMVSDDTEHTCFVAQSLIASGQDPEMFSEHLARALREWLLTFPAGIGWATLRAVLRLWMGWPPLRSGVFSAGNGPAMRSPLLGVVMGHDPEMLRAFVRAATVITHTDPKAFQGALAVAIAAWVSATSDVIRPDEYMEKLSETLGEGAGEFLRRIGEACESAESEEALSTFAAAIGCGNGISGYMFHTIPCVIQTWLRHQKDFQKGISEIISAGGDADTTAAILGGIIGAKDRKNGIPAGWLQNIWEWPRSAEWMESLARALWESCEKGIMTCPPYFRPGLPLRNFVFLLIVLLHGFRRLFPPYG